MKIKRGLQVYSVWEHGECFAMDDYELCLLDHPETDPEVGMDIIKALGILFATFLKQKDIHIIHITEWKPLVSLYELKRLGISIGIFPQSGIDHKAFINEMCNFVLSLKREDFDLSIPQVKEAYDLLPKVKEYLNIFLKALNEENLYIYEKL